MQPDLTSFLGVRDAAILSLFIGTGMRLSGLINLNESDLIFTRYDGREELIVRVKEKGKKERLIPAPVESRLMVRAYLGHHELDAINRLLPNGDKVLFVTTANRNVPEHDYYGEARRLTVSSVQKIIKKYGEMAEVPADQCHAHAFRHLYGTELVEDDVSLLKIQALMGHASADTTKAYITLAMRTLHEAVQKSNPLSKMQTPVSDLAKALS